jgi:p-cumate 2,3-dioxygenase subunit beta
VSDGVPERLLLRLRVEEFLIEEAWLLDEWKLREWAALFTEDAKYYVPALDAPDGAPSDTVYLISDDIGKIRSRVDQLLSGTAWVESPHSKTRRIVGNVRIEQMSAEAVITTASFIVTRSRRERTDRWAGYTRYRLEPRGDSFAIAERTVYVSQQTMRPQNMISIVL